MALILLFVCAALPARALTICVVGDSLATTNNGASATSWPMILQSKIRDGGVFDLEVRNYSLPGLTWRSAWFATPGFLIGGRDAPLQAARRDGCQLLLVSLGVNDRSNPEALRDALNFREAASGHRIIWVHQRMFYPEAPGVTVVSAEEQQRMDQVAAALGGEGFSANLWALADLGFSYDSLHFTNTAKQWIANAVYMYLQSVLPLTPIRWNIWLLWTTCQTDQATCARLMRIPE